MRVSVSLVRSHEPLSIDGVIFGAFEEALAALRTAKPLVLSNIADDYLLVRRDMVASIEVVDDSNEAFARIGTIARAMDLGEEHTASVDLQWMHGSRTFAFKLTDVAKLIGGFDNGGYARKEPLRVSDVIAKRTLVLPDRSVVCWIKSETQRPEKPA